MTIKTVQSWDDVPIMLDLPMACRILGLSYECVKKMARESRIPAHKIADQWRIDKDELRNWILNC